ncbi:thiamine pyrophosphate-binding protein [Eggerthella sp. YY7918]|uniref:thiamine pyrophosphate-binding protein n=1 Tax=Eggerthella sp. (strain YY7918) TaxID=502558 RepID=UPI000217135B|nr:thiamine pyrophosphate-binding protein [Eggerthella sp. YY7918]BAK44795.1 thiamine pyrophosphate-requiring enzyme [Eggerthella sp. YY7918]
MKKRVADIIVDILEQNEIDVCFSVVGGGAMHLNNAFKLGKDRIATIYNHHEQACTMAAEGYARLTGKMASVCVTAGPGGTNAINGVQGAWVDSLPMIVISGFPRFETTAASTALDIRTRGVQENDIVAQVKSITKYAVLVTDPLAIKAELQKAITLAMSGRRGPVWISVPLDVQSALVEEEELYKYEPCEHSLSFNYDQLQQLEEMLQAAERPCILTGSGIRTGNAHALYCRFVNNVQIPIVGGALQADINANGDKYYYGMSGNIGPRCGNFILQSADLILVLGNSLGTCQTGFYVEGFAPNAKIVMVDAEEDEAKKPGLHIDMFIHADIKNFFEACLDFNLKTRASNAWFNHCDELYKRLPRYEIIARHASEFKTNDRVPIQLFWKEFLEQVPSKTVIALGNSSCVRGLLQVGIDDPEQRVLVNYNCGSMGDDLPEAIGACMGTDQAVYCVTGDGSIMLNIQELQTIRHHDFPIKIILCNNKGYGAIRASCKNYFDGMYNGCDAESGLSFPAFDKVADAFGIPYRRSSCIGELHQGLDWLIKQKGPCILEVDQRIDDFNEPRVVSCLDSEGRFVTPAIHEMTPLLPREDIQKYLLEKV